MAKTTELELAIKIAGKIDPSLYKSIGAAQGQVSNLAKGMQNAAKLVGAGVAAAATLAATGFVSAIKEAVAFEEDMAGVVKVTEGLRDENGKLTDTYYEIADAIQELSTQIPVTTEELTSMAAIGAQSGVPVDELVKYAEDASKMAIAFEMDPTQAGEMMAKWRTAFGMEQNEVVLLADEINYLANRTASSEEQISDVVTRIGNLGEIGGVATETLAVLGAVLTSNGMESENAATAIKRMILELTSGESVTARQAAVLDKLGISATGLAETMQTDSVAAMRDFLGAINDLPKAEQLSALNDFFGGWAVQGVANLSENLPDLEEWLALMSDEDVYAGSMELEYEGFASTTASAIQMVKNAWQVLLQDIGSYELDNVRLAVLGVRDVLVDIIEDLPNIMARVDEFFGYWMNHLPQLKAMLIGIGAAWTGMRFAPEIETAAGWIGKLLPGGQKSAAAATTGGAAGAAARQTASKAAKWTNMGGAAQTIVQTVRQNGAGAGISAILPNLDALLTGQDIVVDSKGKGANRRASAADVIAKTASGFKLDQAMSGASNAQMIGQSLGDIFSQTKAGKAANSVGGYLGGIKGALTKNTIPADSLLGKAGAAIANSDTAAAFGNIIGTVRQAPGAAAGAVKGAAGGLLGKIASTDTGMALGNILGNLGKAPGAIKGAAGVAAGAAKATGIGSVLGNLAGAGAATLAPAAGAFGSILTGALPVVGVLGSIVAVVSILGDNLDGIRTIIGNVFGTQGVAVFDGFLGTITNVKDTIVGAFSPENLAMVRQGIVGIFGEGAGGAFDGLVNIGQTIVGLGQQIVTFGTQTVKPIFESVFGWLSTTAAPMLMNFFSTIAPIVSQIIGTVGNAVMTVATGIGNAILQIMPAIQTILTILMQVGSVVGPAILGGISAVFTSLGNIVTNVMGIFQGLIDFICGVFTGNWQQAWDGVKQIFGNAFDALVELCKVPINGVIGLINGAIDGINSLFGGGVTIPEWVPIVGGSSFSFSLPKIPLLAAGGFTNGISIAGEAGTEAVISFDPAYRSANIQTWQAAGRMLGVDEGVEAKSFGAAPAGGGQAAARESNPTFVFSPNITIQGSASREDVSTALRDGYEQFKTWVARYERERRRTAY